MMSDMEDLRDAADFENRKANLRQKRDELSSFLEVITPFWGRVATFLDSRKANLIKDLVGKNNEELRGRIKELQDFTDLPAAIKIDVEYLEAALSELDAAEDEQGITDEYQFWRDGPR